MFSCPRCPLFSYIPSLSSFSCVSLLSLLFFPVSSASLLFFNSWSPYSLSLVILILFATLKCDRFFIRFFNAVLVLLAIFLVLPLLAVLVVLLFCCVFISCCVRYPSCSLSTPCTPCPQVLLIFRVSSLLFCPPYHPCPPCTPFRQCPCLTLSLEFSLLHFNLLSFLSMSLSSLPSVIPGVPAVAHTH